MSYRIKGRSLPGRYRASTNLLQTGPSSFRVLHGFGQTEEVVEAIVETASPPARTGLKLVIATGALGLLGLGLFYGLTQTGPSGTRYFRGAV